VGSRQIARSRLIRWAIAASLFAIVPRAASGEPTAADKETARSLLNEGDRMRDAKDLRGALGAYQAADAIMGVPTTAIEVAKTQERLGMLVEARDAALRIARFPASPSEPRAFQQARAAAERLASDLSLRVPSIRVVVRGASADEVTLEFDGAVIPKAAAPMPRKVNPGKHVVVASADGYERARAELMIEERENRDVEVSLAPSKEGRSRARVGATPSSKDESGVVRPPLPPSDREPAAVRTSPFVYIGGAVAAAGLTVGTVAGIAELGQKSKADSACFKGGDVGECMAAYDSAHRLATVSNVSFGVGALGAAIAIFALLREPSKTRAASFPSNLLLVVQPSAASVTGTF
jgi:hypothetical protein